MQEVIRGKVSDGRVVVPAELRKECGIEDGMEVIFRRSEHGIEIQTIDQIVKQAQALCARFIPSGVSLVDELIQERREEAARE